MQLLCSTGAFSRHPDRCDPPTVAGGIHELGAEGIEVIFYTPWYDDIDHAAAEIRATGAATPVLHTEKSIGGLASSSAPGDDDRAVELLTANCRLAQALDARTLVLHLWSQPDTEQTLSTALEALPRLLDAAVSHGLDLSVETIWRTSGSPLAAIHRALATDPRARVTLDTEFLAVHGELEAALDDDQLWASGAVDHVQIKDSDGSLLDEDGRRTYLHPGQGSADLEGFIRGLHARGYTGTVSLEASAVIDAESVDFGRIHESLTAIASWIP